MSRWKETIIAVLILLLATVVGAGFNNAEATQYTLSPLTGTHGGVAYSYYTHTFSAITDTVTINLIAGQQSLKLTNPFILYFYSARGATDSVNSFAVRYEWSADGSNWESQTLGTDSTTWATTNVYSTAYKLTTIAMVTGVNANGGISTHPYMRIRIWESAFANKGGRVKVFVNYQR